jgi:hypothetical protein
MEHSHALLRYRFDSFEQVLRHLHVVDGATLAFLPDPPGLPVDGRLLLELIVSARAQQTVVRGEVVARADGGGWLQIPDARLAACIAAGNGFADKREGRVSADQLLQFRSASGLQLIGKLLDVGTGGMRVRGVPGMLLGETYTMQLLGAPAGLGNWGRAEVVRIEEPEAGLRFLPPRSPQVPRYIQLQIDAWMCAPEIAHPAGCCVRGALIEPPLPKVATAALGT